MRIYLNVLIFLVFILTSSSIFSKEEIDITKSKSFMESSGIYNQFLNDTLLSILIDSKDLARGENFKIKYDFKNPEYKKLLEEYKISDIAKGKSSFEKIANVMDYFAYRLTHDGKFDAKIKDIKEFKGKAQLSALDLLRYSLDNKDHGINCTYKAEILKEIGLALGIYTRRVHIVPYSVNVDKMSYESHWVNEIWDESLNKWIMLDMTSNAYWVDSKKTPLSILELRNKLINKEEDIKVVWGSHPIMDLDLESRYKDPSEYKLEYEAEQHFYKIYYLKNLYLMQYEAINSVGFANNMYNLVPNNSTCKNKVSKYLISRSSVEASPIEK